MAFDYELRGIALSAERRGVSLILYQSFVKFGPMPTNALFFTTDCRITRIKHWNQENNSDFLVSFVISCKAHGFS